MSAGAAPTPSRPRSTHINVDAAHHREQFAGLPPQEERDAKYSRKMAAHPLYFVQTCNGEVVEIFHAEAEDVAILNMKKSFLQTISLRMSGKRGSSSSSSSSSSARAKRKQAKRKKHKNVRSTRRAARQMSGARRT